MPQARLGGGGEKMPQARVRTAGRGTEPPDRGFLGHIA